MPNYVILYRFTDQGARQVRQTVERAADVRKRYEERGFKIRSLLWTQGNYDLVAVIEAPNEAATMASLLAIAEAGNARSTTMQGFDEEEMAEILGMVSEFAEEPPRGP